jgi:hypothetical protein
MQPSPTAARALPSRSRSPPSGRWRPACRARRPAVRESAGRNPGRCVSLVAPETMEETCLWRRDVKGRECCRGVPARGTRRPRGTSVIDDTRVSHLWMSTISFADRPFSDVSADRAAAHRLAATAFYCRSDSRHTRALALLDVLRAIRSHHQYRSSGVHWRAGTRYFPSRSSPGGVATGRRSGIRDRGSPSHGAGSERSTNSRRTARTRRRTTRRSPPRSPSSSAP